MKRALKSVGVKTPQQVWAIRFVQALFEASTFSGTHVCAFTIEACMGQLAHLCSISLALGTKMESWVNVPPS